MSRFGNFSLLGLVAVFVVIRLVIGDWMGAFLSLVVLVLALALVLAIAGYFASNIPVWLRRLRGISWEDQLKQLEAEDNAFREHYQTSRVVTFEDLNTACLVHLVDLGDRRVLCLYGQHYYDFEPIEDDPEVNQARKFPTKSFSLLRRKSNGEVLELFPGTDVLEPTNCRGVSQLEKIYELGIRLEDGELISNICFEALEKTCKSLGSRAHPA